MEGKKSNNGPIYAIIAAVAIIVIAIIVGVVIVNSDRDDDDDKGQGTVQTEGNNTAAGNNTNSQTSNNVMASELANVDMEVAFGDYDAMQTLAKDIQNGRMTGKVVRIDGLVSRPGSKYSIVQQNASGSQKIGTEFIIEDSADYPDDGDRVILIGKVVEKEPTYFVIATLDDFVDDVDGVNDHDDDGVYDD